MKETYVKTIEKINFLNEKELEEYLGVQKKLPMSIERKFSIGYGLLKLNRLDEAYDFLEDFLEDNFEKVKILLTGYYKGIDGDWHSYDDSCGSGGNGDSGGDGDCCGLTCGCCGCIGCVECCVHGGGLDCICDTLCNWLC